jgi:hypothetical protein
VAMSVPPGTLTDEGRAAINGFYGELLGWREMKRLARPDRLTLSIGDDYINIRERPDPATYSGYEHFGVVVSTAEQLDALWHALEHAHAEVLEPIETTAEGFANFTFRHLLPMAIEVQFFP